MKSGLAPRALRARNSFLVHIIFSKNTLLTYPAIPSSPNISSYKSASTINPPPSTSPNPSGLTAVAILWTSARNSSKLRGAGLASYREGSVGWWVVVLLVGRSWSSGARTTIAVQRTVQGAYDQSAANIRESPS
jgi:hypothetical protein